MNSHKSQANAGPLGLCSFALTLFVYSMYLVGAGGITNYDAGLGLALFYGGFIQLLAGILEMIRGDVFHGTAFSSYGGYWICFGFINFDATGITSSYKDNPEMLNNALGVFLVGWTIYTLFMLLCTLKTNLVLISIFILLFLANMLLTISVFTGIKAFEVASGVLGIVNAFFAWYLALALMLTNETSYFTLNIWPRVHSQTLSS